MSFTSVPVADNAEATAKFIDGSCDAIPGQTFALQGLKEALDQNGSMNGVDIWIGGPVGVVSSEYYDYSWLSGYNYLNLTISQSSGEASYLSYAYAEITLTGTCISNCTGQDDVITQTITFDLDGGSRKGRSEPSKDPFARRPTANLLLVAQTEIEAATEIVLSKCSGKKPSHE